MGGNLNLTMQLGCFTFSVHTFIQYSIILSVYVHLIYITPMFIHSLSYIMYLTYIKVFVLVQESLLQIVAAATFTVVAAALDSHVNEASRRGWTLPAQLAKGTVMY